MKPATPKFWEIPGVEGYCADAQGRIYSLKRWRTPRRMAEQINRYGYPVVHVHIEGKSCTIPVHRLVCLAHNGEPMYGEEVRHIDGTRTNNKPANLKWATRSINAKDRAKHGTSKSGENGRNAARRMLADGRLVRRSDGTFRYKGAL